MTTITIERRERGGSKWAYYTNCQDNGGELTEETALAEVERLAARYEHYRFQAVREVKTREVLQSVSFCRLISQWMEREKVSYAEAVDRLGLSPVVLGQLLAGNRRPTEEQRAAMVEKMGYV